MKRLLPLIFLASCAPSVTKITNVHEYNLKSITQPEFETGLIYTEYRYIMHGAISSQERTDRIGNYYYISWDDAQPQYPAKLVFQYQQGATGSKVLSSSLTVPPRESAASNRQTVFVFNGPERKKQGDILAWKLTLWVNGKEVSTKQSFLWQNMHEENT